jgi:hypothetical protein
MTAQRLARLIAGGDVDGVRTAVRTAPRLLAATVVRNGQGGWTPLHLAVADRQAALERSPDLVPVLVELGGTDLLSWAAAGSAAATAGRCTRRPRPDDRSWCGCCWPPGPTSTGVIPTPEACRCTPRSPPGRPATRPTSSAPCWPPGRT